MANPLIDTHLDAPDPTWHPTNMVDLFARIDERLRSEFESTNSYIPYVISDSTPSVDDQDKVWIKTQSGRPVQTMIFYAGNWRQIYNGAPGEVKIFIGDPSASFDGTGLGLIGSLWDGWALCNGMNGAPDLSDMFICSAHMNNNLGVPGYSTSGWQSMVTGGPEQRGGANQFTLAPYNTYIPPTTAVIADKWASSSGESRNSSGELMGAHSPATSSADSFTLVAADPGNPTPAPIAIIPTFFSYALAAFVGYT
jgi:hypothetical protein